MTVRRVFDKNISIILLQFFKNISYYAGIMLNAFSHLYYAQSYAGIIGCRVPIQEI